MGAVKAALADQPLVHGGGAVATLLARALDRVMSVTIDAQTASGEELSIAQAGAREQALEALEAWSASRG